jgi:cyclophilin family peptidyl-prolyl cis-trans isomerase
MRMFFVFLAALGMVACKPKSIAITQQNVREVLTQYGKDNPENEVLIETPYGNIALKLYDETPLHRANFVKLIKDGDLDDAEFYRVVNEFMIQGGEMALQLPYRIPPEFNRKYIPKKGTLSMARPIDNNPNMESSAEQFFYHPGNTLYQGGCGNGDEVLWIDAYPGTKANLPDRRRLDGTRPEVYGVWRSNGRP